MLTKDYLKLGSVYQLEASPCKFSNEEINLIDLRHPLLAFSNKKIISNTVTMNPKRRILLLSEPVGGKTVLLKAVGLAAQMARCGLLICASPNSVLPFFKNLVVSVGDAQSVDADLSTFAAHLKTLDFATTCQGLDTLLLLDEICGSTDPEGDCCFQKLRQTYRESGVYAVITSHLGALKRGWDEGSGIINGSLDFDSVKGLTLQVHYGHPWPVSCHSNCRTCRSKKKNSNASHGAA